MEFRDRKVLVTGGSRGIGRAVAVGFARRGARVAVNYRRNEAAAEETVAALPGGPHVALQADVADPKEAESLVERAVSALGGLDVLINNAGVGGRHRIDEVGYGDWQAAWNRILAVNLLGSANLAYCAARHMIANGGGRLIGVSSRGAFRGEPDQPAYGASKAALNALNGSLAQQLAPHGIFVGTVAPGFVETEMAADRLAGPEGDAIREQSPLGRVARPHEVAHAVLFLASDDARFATGTIIDVNGASYLRT